MNEEYHVVIRRSEYKAVRRSLYDDVANTSSSLSLD